jgi:hypothetical protein
MRNPDPDRCSARRSTDCALGVAGLPWTPELRQWQARVR